jgi:hypothetical protein
VRCDFSILWDPISSEIHYRTHHLRAPARRRRARRACPPIFRAGGALHTSLEIKRAAPNHLTLIPPTTSELFCTQLQPKSNPCHSYEYMGGGGYTPRVHIPLNLQHLTFSRFRTLTRYAPSHTRSRARKSLHAFTYENSGVGGRRFRFLSEIADSGPAGVEGLQSPIFYFPFPIFFSTLRNRRFRLPPESARMRRILSQDGGPQP